MATRLMTPFCMASVLLAALIAEGAIADSFPKALERVDAAGDMGGVLVGTGDSVLGIRADLWQAAQDAA